MYTETECLHGLIPSESRIWVRCSLLLNQRNKTTIRSSTKKAYECWVELVKEGVSKEIAQYVLPRHKL